MLYFGQFKEGENTERISKPPEIRKQEILDAAMRLFCEKGYESTSMENIARELHVVQGLCYRYFPSKQALFDAAMQQYVEECSADFIKIIHDSGKTIQERLGIISALMANEEETSRYHAFYHKPGNEALHEMMSIRMCKYMIPHVQEELGRLCREGTIQVEKPKLMTEFIMYGQLSLLQDQAEPYPVRLRQIRMYIEKLLGLNTADIE
jgi:AcrR family transcriptional regulator